MSDLQPLNNLAIAPENPAGSSSESAESSPMTRRRFVQVATLAPVLIHALDQCTRAEEAVSTQASSRPAANNQYDYVVVGAGHNSLICAAYLSKAGYRPRARSAESDRRRLPNQ